jgi:hypothetical protein
MCDYLPLTVTWKLQKYPLVWATIFHCYGCALVSSLYIKWVGPHFGRFFHKLIPSLWITLDLSQKWFFFSLVRCSDAWPGGSDPSWRWSERVRRNIIPETGDGRRFVSLGIVMLSTIWSSSFSFGKLRIFYGIMDIWHEIHPTCLKCKNVQHRVVELFENGLLRSFFLEWGARATWCWR